MVSDIEKDIIHEAVKMARDIDDPHDTCTVEHQELSEEFINEKWAQVIKES